MIEKILFVGLGNIGEKYKNTRHNIGFLSIDKIACKYDIVLDNKKFNGLFGKKKILEKEILLLKPETMMNNSGFCVKQMIDFFKIDLNNVYIIYDDLDMKTGKVRYKENGSSGGQNGMKNIIQCLSTENVKRFKIGIGIENRKRDAADFVLSNFSDSELVIINQGIEKVVELVNQIIIK
ncbi:MAG: aminoacyl-tRNA hydrolase [Mycoplasmoidaceae bacterium]